MKMTDEEGKRRGFIKCGTCCEWFDPMSLDQVMKHETDHKEKPDIQYSGSRRIR